jgi:hypothetical protein
MGVRDRLGNLAVEITDVLGNALPPRCPIPWRPNAFAPVFSGFRDYAPSRAENARFRALGLDNVVVELGAPTRLRVWFPSIGGSPQYNEILQPCGRYPLVLFAHGMCGDQAAPDPAAQAAHYLTWGDNPIVRQQARAGYVVVVPQLAGASPGSEQDVDTLRNVLEWIRTDREHANLLADPPATAMIGHSRGGVHAARLVLEDDVSAYVSLSGDFHGLVADEAISLVTSIDVPKLIAVGDSSEGLDPSWTPPEDGDERLPGTWQELSLPKHEAVIDRMAHFDYLAPEVAPCQDAPGPCLRVPRLIADIVTMFLARYLPPPAVSGLPTQVPATLIPPVDWDADLSVRQIFYSGSYLTGVGAWPSSTPECRLVLTFETSGSSGVITLPE